LEEKFELTVESKLENLQRIGEFIDKAMRHYGVSDIKEIHAVQLSVDEACTNIIEHAYVNKQGTILIRCTLSSGGKKFVVDITDWGQAFDPTTIPDPNTELGLNERREGGLGIFFMKKFMDEINYTRTEGMNLLTLAKNIKKTITRSKGYGN
jgi:serine/threonine-protein kinase RsbW